MEEVGMAMNGAGGKQAAAARLRPACPRCHSGDTKFCYYNNYSLSQPRYHCRSCRRYWTQGGSLRNVPVGGGCRNRSSKQRSTGNSGKTAPTLLPDPDASSSSGLGPTAMASSMVNLIPNMLPAFIPPPGWGSGLVPLAAAAPSFLDILRSGGGLLPIDSQNNTDYFAGIGMTMPLPAMSSFGTAMVQQQQPELAVSGMGGTMMLEVVARAGEEGAGDGGVGALAMPMPMAGLEWQPQLIGGINGGAESSGVAQQHLGAGENNMTDNNNHNNNNNNGGEGSSRDDYYWINDNNNGGLINNSSSLM